MILIRDSNMLFYHDWVAPRCKEIDETLLWKPTVSDHG